MDNVNPINPAEAVIAPAADPARRDRMIVRASLIVLVLAILVSGYLSYLKLSNESAVCVQGSVFDCGVVLNSIYSEVAGIPIAWLGLATNLLVVGLLVLESRIGLLRNYGPALVFGVVLFAFLYSVYLVYLQAFVIGAFCPWCLTHEALIAVLFGLALWRLLRWQSQTE
ncbi:MAG: vitamin K epoxide reductase family protein [Chloroflexi bacterium]|nr:vitamin K epoxide reductase family protein [Chloroflexota bacterium]